MGDGTRENPYTREDVIRLIEENGGTAKELDLSQKVFEEGIDLSSLDLRGIILKKAALVNAYLESADLRRAHLEGADLQGANLMMAELTGGTHRERDDSVYAPYEGAYLESAHLEGADLTYAHFEGVDLKYAHLERTLLIGAHFEGADLQGAHLEGADLLGAHLQGTNLSGADIQGTALRTAYLEGAYLGGAKFNYETDFEDVHWGNYKLGEEAEIYRGLRMWYTQHGIYDIAGEFFFREMEAKRKRTKWWPQPWHRLWSQFVSLICGYGERPLRVIGWAASVVLVSALIYFVAGSVWEWPAFWNSLYFSAVSFTALGYGSWLQTTNDWIRGIGAFESFIGVFTIALFLITFIRKMRR